MVAAESKLNTGRGRPSSKSTKPTTASSKSISSNHDVRAMRHLRSIVESIAADETLSQAERYKKISNFEGLLELAEKRTQEEQSMMPTEPVSKTVGQKKKRGWLKTRLIGKQDKDSVQNVIATPVKADVPHTERVETVTDDEPESRGEIAVQRYDDITGHESATPGREPAPADGAAKPSAREQRGDCTVDTCTDSIMGMRMQNSEEYVASICSVRSLGTFERDFINNIIAEQMATNDQLSVSTFEKDFLARQTNGENVAHPTQVFIRDEWMMNTDAAADDLTLGTMLSETTFEQDARSITESKLTPPAEVTATSGENDIFDDLSTGSNQPETTFDRQLKMRNEPHVEARVSASTPRAIFNALNNITIKRAMSNDSLISVSTYEKDMAALNTLAVKIGRTPSTKTNTLEGMIPTTASDRSCSTFEKDAAMRAEMMANKSRANTGLGMNPSEQSTSTFEKDYQVRTSSKPESFATMSEAAAAAHTARWNDTFNRMGIQVTEAGRVMPKISPLVVELSPDTIEKEVKLREREGTLWGKFACFTGW
jgi:hypothetical protein